MCLRLGSEARRSVERDHDLDQVARSYLRIFDQVTAPAGD
jgi:hypothetical protein